MRKIKGIFSKLLTSGIFLMLMLCFIVVVIFSLTAYFRTDSFISLLKSLKPQQASTPFAIHGVGVMGDSQSDEYQADDARGSTYAATTLNYVELLAKYRKLDFGQWGIWGEPRRTGYEYNYARSGATTSSMIASGQHIGIAEKVKAGKVNLVIIYIGANDFGPYITSDGYQAIYSGDITRAQILYKENRVASDIKTAIDTIRDAGNVKLLLVLIPDWGQHVGVQAAFPFPDQRRLVTNVINETNTQLRNLANSYGIVTVDPTKFYQEVLNHQDKEGIKIAQENFTRVIPGDEPHSLVLIDGVHPGTVMNGLFANFVIEALNSKIGTKLSKFTDKDILQMSGL